MANPVKCPCCGKLSIEYKATLSKGLAKVLWQLYLINKPVKSADLDLNYSERSNAHKLRYWRLITIDNNLWELTDKGTRFVQGNIDISVTISHRDKEIFYESNETISFANISMKFLNKKEYQEMVLMQLYAKNPNQVELFNG